MEFDLGRLLTEESKRMMNCLHEGIFIADKMGNIVFANQALLEMAGGTEEYALSLNVFDFKKQGVDVNKDQLLAQRALETKRRITRISEVKITTGYSYRQLGTATPLLDDEGEIQYIVVEMQTLDHIQRTYQDGLYEQREDFIEEVKKDSSPFICVNPNMKSILNMAKRIADMDTTILITGETGTGKQVLVDYIVSQSHLASKQVVSINCSSIPENLFESELFGYESGSFTGASKNGKMGLFEAADIDGATTFQKIRYITIPAIRSVSTTVFLLLIIWTIKDYAIAYVLTKGGPSRATELLTIYIQQTGFKYFDFGKASAAGMLMLLVALAFTFFYFKVLNKEEE